MFLNEPPPSRGEIHFVLFGFPVRVHPFFWLATLFLGSNSENLQSLLAWIAAVFVAILVHELGHALVMRAYGLRPAITLHGLGGVTSDRGSGQFVPRLYAFEQILISLAGPAAGFLLAAVVCGILAAVGRPAIPEFGPPYGIRLYFPNLRAISPAGRVCRCAALYQRHLGTGQPVADLSLGRRANLAGSVLGDPPLATACGCRCGCRCGPPRQWPSSD